MVTLSPHTSCGVLGRIIGFTKARVGYTHPYLISARRRNCDGDEDSAMLLMDALLNFSRKFLPEARGGTMDACLVLTTVIDPKEVDDEVYGMEVCKSYPLEFYEASLNFENPADVKIDKVGDRIGKSEQYSGINFTHSAGSIHDAPTKTRYVELKSMNEKIDAQFSLCEKIRAVNIKDAAERVILSHFLPDLYGNLRSFSKQTFRCSNCNMKYRRVPLSGKCTKCGGKLLLTVSKGGIEKYLKISKDMALKYGLPDYLKQRLALLENDIKSIFEDQTKRQFNLSEFM
jgi:DNA polymerase II large subunit